LACDEALTPFASTLRLVTGEAEALQVGGRVGATLLPRCDVVHLDRARPALPAAWLALELSSADPDPAPATLRAHGVECGAGRAAGP
jgi:hypothetical protein